MKAKLLSYWKPLASVTFWGISFIATKIALEELAPLSIIFLRLIFASILLAVLAVYSNKKLDLSWKNHGSIFILALIAVFHLWIQVTGMQYTTAANTGWIIGTAPIFMAIVGYIAFKESLSPIRIFGILLAFFGFLMLISKGDFSSIDLLSNKGDFLILASAFTWSIYSAVNKKISLTYSPLLTVLFLFLMMAVIISPFSISSQSIQSVKALSTKSWIAIFFLGIFCSGVAYVLWAQALKEMDSVKVGAFLYFEPFVTVFAAWLILSEEITFLMIVSGVVITLGVLLVNFNLRSLFRRD
ncbi:MAG: DMT family transporter [Ignavibacteriaceae bacterium]|nr:DMT family transporter [Ignavibacteriaceae bacterium]